MLVCAVCLTGTFTCTVCLEEQPLLRGKLMSCCVSVEEGGHGRNLCAQKCFYEWVQKGGPQCPTCRKSWTEEVPRGKWLQRFVDVQRAYDEEDSFLSSRILNAVRRYTVHKTTVAFEVAGEPGGLEEIHVTTEEKEIAVVPSLGDPTILEELDVREEKRELRRRRSRANAALRHEERMERGVEERRLWAQGLPKRDAPRTALECSTAAYEVARTAFLVDGKQESLDALIQQRNHLRLAHALGSQLDLMDKVDDYCEAQSQLVLETPSLYEPAPGSGPLSFAYYLRHFCSDESIE